MTTTVKQTVTVQPDGKIELRAPEFTPGARAKVTVQIENDNKGGKRRPLSSFVGAGKGRFRTAEDVDGFIRRERDAWE